MTTPPQSTLVRRLLALLIALTMFAVAGYLSWRLFVRNTDSEWGQIVVRPPRGASRVVDGTASAPPTIALPAGAPGMQPLAGVPRFTTALARGLDGAVWVGSEDEGLVRYDPITNAGRVFTSRDGLGDDSIYALAVDTHGRVWAGHLNHGVSVYDGNVAGRWQNYEVVGGLSRLDSLSGPIGERVFDIAICPADGDVWIATNCGLSRYSESRRAWSYYSRLNGLPADDVCAIAFDAAGNLYAATPCDGLAIADAANGYQRWRSVHGPARPPTTVEGPGLPSDLLNDVLITATGVVYVATDSGLAFSSDHGWTFRFVRGRDWADKVRQRRGGAPADWQATGKAMLSDDFCTVLAEDAARGTLWIGHPGGPVETIDLRAGGEAKSVAGGHWPRAILMPAPNGSPVVTVAGFGDGDGGLWRTPAVGNVDGLRAIAEGMLLPPTDGPPMLPAAATPMTADELGALARRVSAAAGGDAPNVAILNDDWRTQGAWLGRYGKFWACLSAMDQNDYLWGATPKPLAYARELGPGHPANYVQFWRTALYTDNPKSLEMPRTLFDAYVKQGRSTWATDRRQADWNDAGEQYPKTHDGPDLYISVDVPAGEYTLSLYDYNKDGHAINSDYRGRDMTVGIYHRPVGSPLQFVANGGTESEKPIVRRRLHDFWGGLYQRFYVRGPGVITVGCHRIVSPNLMLSAVLFDTLDERPAPFDELSPASAATQSTGVPPIYAPGRAVLDAECERFHLAASTALPNAIALPSLETCQFSLCQFAAWERSQESRGVRPIRNIEQALRWDGVRQVTKGCGLALLKEYLSSQTKLPEVENGGRSH